MFRQFVKTEGFGITTQESQGKIEEYKFHHVLDITFHLSGFYANPSVINTLLLPINKSAVSTTTQDPFSLFLM